MEPEIIRSSEGDHTKKEFHVFVCFASEDRDFATQLIEKLEAEPYRLHCFDTQRKLDFERTDHLRRYVEASLKCILVVSPSFLSSDWCKSERGLFLNISQDEQRLVPVVLDECDIPTYLKHLVYIRASQDVNSPWFDFLTRALGYKECSSCKKHGKSTKADKTCTICGNTLCEECVLLATTSGKNTHVWYPLPLSLPTDLITHDKCNKHKRFSLGLYCRDCQEIVCAVCVAIKHRSCQFVVTRSEAVEHWRHELFKDISHMNEEVDKAISKALEIARERHGIIAAKEAAKENVRKITDTLKKMLDDKEQSVLAEIQRVVVADEENALREETCNQQRLQKMNETRSRLKEASFSLDAELIYGALNETKQKEFSAPDYRPSFSQISVQSNMKDILERVSQLTFSIQSLHDEVPRLSEKKRKHSPTLEYQTVIFQRKRTDRIINDMCVLDSDDPKIIVLSDIANADVTCIYIETLKPSERQIDFGGDPPYSLAETSTKMVAASLPESKRVAILKVTPDLELNRMVKTASAYTGLASLSSALLLGGVEYKPSVDIFDLSGTIYRSISLTGIVEYNRHIAMTPGGNVIVADYLHNVVAWVSLTGDFVFRYGSETKHPLASPKMLGTDIVGNVYVLNSGSVTLITEEGSFIQNIFEHNEKCDAMCLDKRGKLYVISATGSLRWYSFE